MSMKIVVLGGSGLVGSKLVDRLALRGFEVVAASRRTGVDALTGRGLAVTLAGAHAVVDATNAPVFEDPEVAEFFRHASERLLQAAGNAGIAHYLALSVVGTERLQGSAYFRAKAIQERQVRQSPVPYTLLRATQFYEFMANIVPAGGGPGPVRLSPAQVQPVAANDVADVLADLVVAPAANGVVELAGPERYRLNELVEWVMYSYQDDRPVVADAEALYYGARLDDDTLAPIGAALHGATQFGDWLDGYLTGAARIPEVHHPDPLAAPHQFSGITVR
ncbi:MAG TPA: SDR family oxidoreductase [Stenotrophomonas sp.]|nr:SDR family oxidoreductase [Stenotrophomonas sp.]